MKRLFDDLKAFVSNELVSKASKVLDEKESNISAASSGIIASMLGVMLKKGDTQQIENILTEAGKLDILSDTTSIWDEKPTKDQQRIGDDFLQHLLGDKAAAFSTGVSKQSGISEVATNRLVSILAPIITGFLGRKLVKDNWNMAHLMNEIDSQKDSFAGFIPADILKAFGLSSIVKKQTAAAATPPPTETPKKKNNSWLIWLIIVALLLLLFFAWRSCRNKKVEQHYTERTEVVTTAPVERPAASQNGMTEITLPNGVKISVLKNGTEEKMINFLLSDEYKNAKDTDLQKKWFTFDKIDFEFNSSTQLMEGSQAQLNNIATILKAFPNAKVRVAGFADKVGSESTNMAISKERAKTIENKLEEAGVTQIVRTEGFGEEYATHSEKESDAARAEDRDIALRFIK